MSEPTPTPNPPMGWFKNLVLSVFGAVCLLVVGVVVLALWLAWQWAVEAVQTAAANTVNGWFGWSEWVIPGIILAGYLVAMAVAWWIEHGPVGGSNVHELPTPPPPGGSPVPWVRPSKAAEPGPPPPAM